MAAATSSPTLDAMVHAANSLWPFATATAILDNGSGPGPVSKRLLRTYGAELPSDCGILCSDFAEGMIAAVQENKKNGGKDWERVETVVQNAMDLKLVQNGTKSHVLAGFVYFMTPDPLKCLTESHRVLSEGGALVASSWQSSQWMDSMLLVARIRPEKTMPALPEAWTTTSGVKGEFEKAGFRDVGAQEVQAEMRFESAKEMVEFFLKKMPHMVAMTKDMSEGEMGQLRALMKEEIGRMSEGEGHPGVLKGVSVVGWGREVRGVGQNDGRERKVVLVLTEYGGCEVRMPYVRSHWRWSSA